MKDRSTPSIWSVLCLSLMALLMLAPTADAQKMGTKKREFPAHGFYFKPIHDMLDVPVNDNLKSYGAIGQFKAQKTVPVKLDDGQRGMYLPTLMVVRLDPIVAKSGEGKEKEPYVSVEDVVDRVVPGLKDVEWEDAAVTTEHLTKEIDATRYELVGSMLMNFGSHMELVVDVYEISLVDYKLVMVWEYPGERKYRKSWEKAIKKSMKSFDLMRSGAEEIDLTDVNSESSYADLFAFHTHDVEQTPGWRLVETPSKQYLIKTNVEKKDNKDIDEVVRRIEASRRLYEEDFPPPFEITSVSVIRLCATQEDFNIYGQTGAGVAGYFNPGSEELVLYFGSGGQDMTLSVMTHEGFHQYCHFLFNRSTAHRWFDEGHGDYYGAWEMRGKKLVPEDDMKGGLARIPEIKQMLKEHTIKPLSEHIRYSHPEWQSQGPSNVSCYAQSFSIIRFLRDGARGKVSRKYWKDEYADIIPNYIESLSFGYDEAYDVIIKQAEEQLEAAKKVAGIDPEQVAAWQERFDRPWDFLDRREQQKIMDQAMLESWGLIDEDEFEKRWLEYVDKVL